MILKATLLLFCAVAIIGACAPNTVINPTPLAQFGQKAPQGASSEYLIGVGDTLDVKFMYNPELNELGIPVRPDGRISLQLAADVPAANLTPAQLRKNLIDRYTGELKKPEIAVIVRTFGGHRVFVDGEVVFPGMIDLRGPMTIMQAIAQSRGLKETARLSNIIVLRKDADGSPMAANIDLRKVIDGTDPSQDLSLLPYDIVYVPKSQIANWNKFIDEYINRAVPGGFPGWTSFNNPYAYSLGGFTKVYPDTTPIVRVAPTP